MRWAVIGCALAGLVTVGTGCTSSNNSCSGGNCGSPIETRATGSSAAVGSASAPPAGKQLVTSIAMPSPGSVVTAFGSVWIGNGPAATVTRLDPHTDAVIARIPTPDVASVVSVGAGAVWVTSYPGNSLSRIDPGNNRLTRTITLSPRGTGPIGVTFFHGFVWVANHDGDPTTSVSKIDPATMRVVDVIPVGGGTDAGPVWILASAGSIWTDVSGSSGVVVRIDPHTDRIVATIPDPSACAQLAANDTGVWTTCAEEPSLPGLSRIDPRTNKVTETFRETNFADAVALDRGSLWFATSATLKLGRVDTRTNKVLCTLDLPGPAFGMAAGAGAIWTTDREDGLLFKVRPADACRSGG